MVATNNPASALRNILLAVKDSGEQTVAAGWEFVLKASIGTTQFALLHGEVVAMYVRVHERLLALPGDMDGKAQYMEYLPAWHEAITYRRGWDNPASYVGDAQAISQLTGLAYAFNSHSLTSKTPSASAIDRLRESLDEWQEILDNADFDESARNELRYHVNRLQLLLSNDLTLGTEPVIEASKGLMGAAVATMTRVSAPFRLAVGKKLAGIVVFIAATHYTLGNVEGITQQANGIIEGVRQLQTSITELTEGPSAIEQRKPAELDSAVIEGEVVDTPPQNPTS